MQVEKRLVAERDGLQSALDKEMKDNRNLRDELMMVKEQLQTDRHKSYLKNDEESARMKENNEKLRI